MFAEIAAVETLMPVRFLEGSRNLTQGTLIGHLLDILKGSQSFCGEIVFDKRCPSGLQLFVWIQAHGLDDEADRPKGARGPIRFVVEEFRILEGHHLGISEIC